MKEKAIVCNIGHFDNEIDIAGLSKLLGIRKEEIKPQVHQWHFPDSHSILVLAEGRLVNLGCATGHPSFVMSNSFSNQVSAQVELWTNNDKYEKKVYVLPKHLDEMVARLHLEQLGIQLTELTPEQAELIRKLEEAKGSALIALTGSSKHLDLLSEVAKSQNLLFANGSLISRTGKQFFFYTETAFCSHTTA